MITSVKSIGLRHLYRSAQNDVSPSTREEREENWEKMVKYFDEAQAAEMQETVWGKAERIFFLERKEILFLLQMIECNI